MLTTNCDVADLFMESLNHDFIIADLRNSIIGAFQIKQSDWKNVQKVLLLI